MPWRSLHERLTPIPAFLYGGIRQPHDIDLIRPRMVVHFNRQRVDPQHRSRVHPRPYSLAATTRKTWPRYAVLTEVA